MSPRADDDVPHDLAFEGSLLPAAHGTCPKCAIAHPVTNPHDQRSLFYQYSFYRDNLRWPTWLDAMRHCSPEIQLLWITELEALGVDVGGASDV